MLPKESDETDPVQQMVEQWTEVFPRIDQTLLAVAKSVARAEDKLAQVASHALRSYDLDAGQFDVLATLLRLGPPHRLSPTALHRSLLISSSGVTKRIDRLEAHGLLRRVTDPADRRSRAVELTSAGHALIERAAHDHIEATSDALRAALGHLDTHQQERLADDLVRLAEGLMGTHQHELGDDHLDPAAPRAQSR